MAPAFSSEQFQKASAGFSVTAKIKIPNLPGQLLEIIKKIAAEEASLSDLTLLYSDFNYNVREITINCKSEQSSRNVIEILRSSDKAKLLEWRDDTFAVHQGGKIDTAPRVEVSTTDQLSRVYTPGVARVCESIAKHPEKAREYTICGNTVAVVTDGSAVLGLGNIGPRAALPVMEGKALLFKQFAGLNAFPICLETQDTEEIIRTVQHISPAFAAINLEDISAPRCFEIEQRLQKALDIPVFHDDQHGTAVVVLAGLINALKIVDKRIDQVRVVVNGFGAGGVACTRMLLQAGVKNIIACDSAGIVHRARTERMNSVKTELLAETNLENLSGSVSDALRGADVFLGVSRPGAIRRADVVGMARDPIVFALANPTPEIMPDEIKDVARVIATGRSDYANQINNVLCFPGIFKGAIRAKSKRITDRMKISAAHAIAECVSDDELHESHIIPSVFGEDVAEAVAKRVEAVA